MLLLKLSLQLRGAGAPRRAGAKRRLDESFLNTACNTRTGHNSRCSKQGAESRAGNNRLITVSLAPRCRVAAASADEAAPGRRGRPRAAFTLINKIWRWGHSRFFSASRSVSRPILQCSVLPRRSCASGRASRAFVHALWCAHGLSPARISNTYFSENTIGGAEASMRHGSRFTGQTAFHM